MTVLAAAEFLPADAEVTLLHVADTEPEAIAQAARRGLLGRHRAPVRGFQELSEAASGDLLNAAKASFERPAQLQARRGRVEREVVDAAEGMDLLILARDGDRERLGPRSLGPQARFVVDHAPCQVLLIWPTTAPAVASIPPPPEHDR